MNHKHREIININRNNLIDNVSFDDIEPYLKQSKMFNKYMWEDIHSMSDVLDLLPFRGPTAFQSMIEVLGRAGYDEQVAALENQRSEAENIDLYYKMSSKPLGYCLIINNEDFVPPEISGKDLKRRYGSDEDYKNLKEFFKTDFEVFHHENLTASEMRYLLEEFSGKDFTLVDCMIVVILSHGGQKNGLDYFNGIDGKELFMGEICNMFNNEKKYLQNKPKIFFFVSCRGTGFDYGAPNIFSKESIDSSVVISSANNNSYLPLCTDMFIYHSTLPDEYSIRDHDKGSYFIQALVPILKKYYLKEDLETMMKRVNEELSTKKSETYCVFQTVHTEKFGDTKKIMLCRRK